uniref:Glycerol-3-phosphate acyltransferase 2, mitochondrial n=1 Tax=Rousettus aegyptiacus TaxID=9407 RepID=A0A7J8FH45_ROUAE|nr:glycerol-3-phosphate acyltransferase 2, mitochondrial [Rousettus aegyptiacus]
MDNMSGARLRTQQRSCQSGRETNLWSSGLGMKLEAVTPFLGKYRPFVGRCCQTCTPKSWESLFHRSIMDLGFCDVILVKEENTRFRGWLVRRLCYFLWSLEQHIPPCWDAPQKVMESTGVQNVISGRAPAGAGEGQVPGLMKKEVQRILGHFQTPPRPFLLRLFSWVVLRVLNCLFLNVQLHKGHMKMVHKAAQAGSPLVLLSTHKSLLDGVLLPFVLLSQGLGVLRVAWEPRTCSPVLRALLRKLGGLFLPPEATLSLDSSEGVLARAVVHAAVEQLLVSGQPLLIFLEEPPGTQGPRLSALGQAWLGLVVQAIQVGVVPDAMLVPVAITYDLVPDAPCDTIHAAAPVGLWTGMLAVLRSLRGWCRGHRVCVRVHLAQPFSLKEYAINARSCWGSRQTLEQLLQPIVLGQSTVVPDTEKEQEWTPVTGPLLALKAEDQLLVRRLSRHILNASVASSAVMSTAITATLLLFKHQQPCQSSYCYCQEVLDRLIQCGLLVAEETPGSRLACDTGRQRLSARLLWKPSGDFTDSDSDDFEEAEGRYFRLSQQSRCPDFFLFLCRLLSPLLKAFAQAAAFLPMGQLPDTESGYTDQLLQFLRATAQEDGFFECADSGLAIRAVWTFRDLGVLQQMPSPAGPMLHLSPTFASRDNQEKLEQFIRQFICG